MPAEALALYRHVNDAVFDLYARGEYRRALDAIERHRAALGPWDAELALLAACLYGQLGLDADSLRVLEEAERRGGWWDPGVLGDDDDLEALRGRPGFQRVVASSRTRWADANARPDRSGDVLVEVDSPRWLLVALHGAEEDGHDAVRAWGDAARRARATLLAVRSSQRTSPAYRTWPDHGRATEEIEAACAALPAELRRLPVVAAGFSAGGRVALRWALEAGPGAVAGVLAMAPAYSASDLGPEPAARLTAGRVWIGSDDDLLPDVDAARPRLAAAGIEVEVIPGLGHGFPGDFAARAVSALGEL